MEKTAVGTVGIDVAKLKFDVVVWIDRKEVQNKSITQYSSWIDTTAKIALARSV